LIAQTNNNHNIVSLRNTRHPLLVIRVSYSSTCSSVNLSVEERYPRDCDGREYNRPCIASMCPKPLGWLHIDDTSRNRWRAWEVQSTGLANAVNSTGGNITSKGFHYSSKYLWGGEFSACLTISKWRNREMRNISLVCFTSPAQFPVLPYDGWSEDQPRA
jgi:hypothetical protein